MPTANKALIFKKVPTDFPVVGEHLKVEDVEAIDLDQSLPPNSLLLETLYVSFDPYMRGRMRAPEVKSYSPPMAVGGPFEAGLLANVLNSTLEGYSKGDVVSGRLPVQQYSVFTRKDESTPPPSKIDPAASPDIRHFLGALGMPGLTAYSSLYEIGKPKKGETIFVSSAAGAVGQLVGQLAKHEGLTVLGSVGSDDKLEFITKELGFDGGWNYKTEKGSTAEILSRLTNGKGIDIFYDNVGGEQLQGALDSLNTFGRVVACGQISQYNLPAEKRYPITNTFLTVAKRLSWVGFIVGDANMGPKHAKAHRENVANWLRDGSFKAKIHETVGIENAAEAFVGMLKGDNFGKAVLKVKQ